MCRNILHEFALNIVNYINIILFITNVIFEFQHFSLRLVSVRVIWLPHLDSAIPKLKESFLIQTESYSLFADQYNHWSYSVLVLWVVFPHYCSLPATRNSIFQGHSRPLTKKARSNPRPVHVRFLLDNLALRHDESEHLVQAIIFIGQMSEIKIAFK